MSDDLKEGSRRKKEIHDDADPGADRDPPPDGPGGVSPWRSADAEVRIQHVTAIGRRPEDASISECVRVE
jgi:hypothetical protein